MSLRGACALGAVIGAIVGAVIVLEPHDTVISKQIVAPCHYNGSGLTAAPDRNCTPGQWIDNGANVCHKGYNPRPPLSVTSKLKRQGLKEYGLPRSASATTESDHLYPVWLGGKTVLSNLWPEPGYAHPPDSYTRNPKDKLEFALYKKVCQSHKLTVAQARKLFEGDWRVAYKQYVGSLP